MEQIVKLDGIYYYGQYRCLSADDAYARFRDDYNRRTGKEFYKRLNQLGRRKERTHGFGVHFNDPSYLEGLGNRFSKYGRVRSRLLGIVGISYCRMIGLWDFPAVADEEFDDWLDWLLGFGTGALYLVGLKQKAGRTSKILHKRYK